MSITPSTETYRKVMSGDPVTEEEFTAAVEHARTKKHRVPRRDTANIITAAVTPSTTCLVDGCDKPARTKGRCSQHYQAWRREDRAVKAEAAAASRRYRERKAQKEAQSS